MFETIQNSRYLVKSETFCQQTYSCHALLLSYLSFPHLWRPCLDISKKDRKSTKTGPRSSALFISVSLGNTPYLSFLNRIAFPYLAYFSEIVAIYCMISTDKQHQLVYSITSLKQVIFITTGQDLSLVSRFTLSSLEPIKCTPFSPESAPKFGTLFLFRLNYLNVRPFVKR